MSNHHLVTYLNDHLAGSLAGLELLEHLHKGPARERLGGLIANLRDEIAADRQVLEGLMKQLRVAPSSSRQAMAWVGEKMTELKLRLDDASGGALRLLEALEALCLGVEGKRLLWLALAAAGVPEPPGTTFAILEQRAADQRTRLEQARREAAQRALHVS